MFANIEIISNNTYNFSTFTYEIPKKFIGKVYIGTVVEIKFRNRKLLGIILNIKDETNIKN
jgi:primosomal protein N'